MDRKALWKELSQILGFTAPLDGLISVASKKISIDLIKLDKLVSNCNPDYDSDKCTYKDKTDVSCSDAIRLIYGDRAVELIEILIT